MVVRGRGSVLGKNASIAAKGGRRKPHSNRAYGRECDGSKERRSQLRPIARRVGPPALFLDRAEEGALFETLPHVGRDRLSLRRRTEHQRRKSHERDVRPREPARRTAVHQGIIKRSGRIWGGRSVSQRLDDKKAGHELRERKESDMAEQSHPMLPSIASGGRDQRHKAQVCAKRTIAPGRRVT